MKWFLVVSILFLLWGVWYFARAFWSIEPGQPRWLKWLVTGICSFGILGAMVGITFALIGIYGA
jgi:hypothetical protein